MAPLRFYRRFRALAATMRAGANITVAPCAEKRAASYSSPWKCVGREIYAITLQDIDVTARLLIQLGAFKEELRMFWLLNCRLADSECRYLADLTSLQSLYVVSPGITDQGVAHLARLPYLSELSLFGTAVHGSAFKAFRETHLRSLNVARTHVDDSSVATLACLASLESVDISDNCITDRGLLELASAPSLREIYVAGTRVSDSGLRQFAERMPNCAVHVSQPPQCGECQESN